MSDDPIKPPPEKPIPTMIWVMLGIVVVLGFVVLLKLFSPSGVGKGPATPDVVAPLAGPKG